MLIPIILPCHLTLVGLPEVVLASSHLVCVEVVVSQLEHMDNHLERKLGLVCTAALWLLFQLPFLRWLSLVQ